jgi:copper chaperone CopZ
MKTLFASLALMFGIIMASPVSTQAQDAQKDKKECAVKGDLAKATFKVDGKCTMCKDRIEKAAKSVEGVKKANWNVDSHKMTFKYHKDKVNKSKVHKAIAQAGHDTEKQKASSEAYASLPMCCKYRDD